MNKDLFCAVCYVYSDNFLSYSQPVSLDDAFVIMSDYAAFEPFSQTFVVPFGILNHVLNDYRSSGVYIVQEVFSL